APEELRAWASAQKIEGGLPGYKVVTTANGSYLAIAGGQQPSGGYSIEIVSAKLVDGTWMIEAKVVAPTGPAVTMITNPVGYFSLNGMKGNVEVKMLSALPNAKVKGGDAQVMPTVVAESALPEELRAWSGALTVEQAASYKVVTTNDGLLVGIAGGMQATGGYRIELIGDARLVDGIWHIEAQVLKPEGMATQVLSNPVAFFKLPGVKGNVHVNFWTNGATP
ncbi:MAG: copper amine oxidase-like protein, partial [Firmicutes bacterium]|nr:copper amine oxidase-like protein [Bacillota bacterium]